MKLLVCGGAGFIGSTFVRQRVEAGDEVVVLDKLTYAGRRENLQDVEHALRPRRDRGPRGRRAARSRAVDAVVNFAAETHVDRSIAEPDAFVKTARVRHVRPARGGARARAALPAGLHRRGLRLDRGGLVHRGDRRCDPSSPYSATKAGADLLVAVLRAHLRHADASICRGSNNYGPRQYPEKLIPLMVLNALHGDPLPVYGDGMQVRNWIYAEDFSSRDRRTCSSTACAGEVYNVGGPDECPNIEVVRRVIELTGADESLIEYVTDRPGHDRRYSLSSDKVRALGWEPQVRFDEGLERDRRLVPRQRVVVGADPLRRLPRVLRAPVRARARPDAQARCGSSEIRHFPAAFSSLTVRLRLVSSPVFSLTCATAVVPLIVTAVTVRSTSSVSRIASLTTSPQLLALI